MSGKEILKDLRDLTQKLMKTEGSVQYELNIEGGVEKGENYAGEVIFYNVSCKDTGKNYNFLFKTCKRSENIKKAGDNIIYNKEIHMYKKVFPCLRSFGEELGASFKLDNVPKAYWISEEANRESLILENLKARGYRVCDRTKPMNLEHVLLVLENYGKLHASSLALKTQRPHQFQQLMTKDLDTYVPGDISKTKKMFKQEFANALGVLRELGKDDLAKKFESFLDNSYEFYQQESESDMLVITHGDCWNNNLMFKYEDGNSFKPLKMCFIDFQLCGYHSPVKDLSYFIYAACDQSTLKQFDLLLKTYHDSFSSTLKSLGCKPEDLFTMEQLKEHWKKYSISGLSTSTVAIKIELCNSNEAPNTDYTEKDGKDFADVFSFQIEDKDEYNRRILDVFTHYADICL